MRRYSRITVKRKPVAGYTAIPPSASGGGLTDTWAKAAADAMTALVPALTRFEYIKAPSIVVGGVGVAVNVEGGAVGVASDTTHYQSFVQASIWNTPRTSPMGVTFRCKFPAIATGKTSVVGIATAGAGGNIVFGWDQGTSATKWVLFPTGGTPVISTFSADTNEHTIGITADGTVTGTITVQLDGVTVATSSAVSTLTNSPCLPSSFSSASLTAGVEVQRLVYGYADPS